MDQEQLKTKLLEYDKEELVERLIALVQEKKELQGDFELLGNTLIMIMQTLGVMDEDHKLVEETSSVIGSITKFATTAMTRPAKIQEKFSFLEKAAPLLIKYKHLLKQK